MLLRTANMLEGHTAHDCIRNSDGKGGSKREDVDVLRSKCRAVNRGQVLRGHSLCCSALLSLQLSTPRKGPLLLNHDHLKMLL